MKNGSYPIPLQQPGYVFSRLNKKPLHELTRFATGNQAQL